MTRTNQSSQSTKPAIRYSVTGSAAHSRLVPLFPSHWQDVTQAVAATTRTQSPSSQQQQQQHPDVLWENAPRHATKSIRDKVKCYSHLPNGTDILDSKWVLARLFADGSEEKKNHPPLLATLPTVCFRGRAGFDNFIQQQQESAPSQHTYDWSSADFPDLDPNYNTNTNHNNKSSAAVAVPTTPPRPNWWVIKDASCNGAGGIWVMDASTTTTTSNSSNDSNRHNNNNNKTTTAAATHTGTVRQQLHPDHAYVAQQYAWPPVLYQGRKCHVRAYGLLTADGRAFLHQQAFLHVANEKFEYSAADDNNNTTPESAVVAKNTTTTTTTTTTDRNAFEDSVHITNCCANSHDASKFAGEICADLCATEWKHIAVPNKNGNNDNNDNNDRNNSSTVVVVPLAEFRPSMQASLAHLAKTAFPLVQGGLPNGGFEYLGLDFILSYNEEQQHQQPIAYLLEVNAPPSQDTATGLPHAEALHNTVLRDLVHLWMVPRVVGEHGVSEQRLGGWQCVYQQQQEKEDTLSDIISRCNNNQFDLLPSKAALFNKMRWALLERKQVKLEQQQQQLLLLNTQQQQQAQNDDTLRSHVVQQIRRYFPYYTNNHNGQSLAQTTGTTHTAAPIFFENAGGAQVPIHVLEAVRSSLSCRDRSVVGCKSKLAAKHTAGILLGVSSNNISHDVFFGSNATCLLSTLAATYAKHLLTAEDEIVISTENHVANVQPWLQAAESVGAVVKWWWTTSIKTTITTTNEAKSSILSSSCLEDLVTEKTRVVAISHASNVLGEIRDITNIGRIVQHLSKGRAHTVVDGVAVAPHMPPKVEAAGVDWYVVSCHKLFGPHIGVLCGRKSVVAQVCGKNPENIFELGTLNYEACEGLVGLGSYFSDLAVLQERMSLFDESGPEEEPCEVETNTDSGVKRTSHESTGVSFSGEQLGDDHRLELAYELIHKLETPLVDALLSGLMDMPKVRILRTTKTNSSLPVVSFVHTTVSGNEIVKACRKASLQCRCCKFLCTDQLLEELEVNPDGGMVRFSLAHYNTVAEVRYALKVLETIPGWR